jgi:hypothetical protein
LISLSSSGIIQERKDKTMIVPVHMTAFGTKDEIRYVELPEYCLFDEVDNKGDIIDQILELVFKYGQNDFQPQRHPSVSVGDIACLFDHYYFLCDKVGWRKISREVFDGIQGSISTEVYMGAFDEKEEGIEAEKETTANCG